MSQFSFINCLYVGVTIDRYIHHFSSCLLNCIVNNSKTRCRKLQLIFQVHAVRRQHQRTSCPAYGFSLPRLRRDLPLSSPKGPTSLVVVNTWPINKPRRLAIHYVTRAMYCGRSIQHTYKYKYFPLLLSLIQTH